MKTRRLQIISNFVRLSPDIIIKEYTWLSSFELLDLDPESPTYCTLRVILRYPDWTIISYTLVDSDG